MPTNVSTRSANQQKMDESAMEAIINKVCEKFMNKIEQQFDQKFEQMSEKFDSLCHKIDNLDKTVETNVNAIQKNIKRMDDIEYNFKKNRIRLMGVKEMDNENLLSIFINLLNNNLKIKCSFLEINNIYRVGKLQKDYTRTIIVEFVSCIKRNEVFNSRRCLKGTGIFINEDLVEKSYKLFMKAIKIFNPRNVWTRGGRIYIKSKNDVVHIKDEQDLSNISPP